MILNGDNLLIATQRVWQAASGLVTSILLVYFISPELQGWYYSLLSLAGLFTLFELGLSQIIIQRAAAASPTPLRALSSRKLIRLLAYANTRFRRAAFAFFGVVFPLGTIIFIEADAGSAASNQGGFDIKIWLVLMAATTANLWALGFLSVLEGVGEIGRVYASRLGQGIAGAGAAWLVLALGGGLWAVVCVPLAGVISSVLWFLPYLKRWGRDRRLCRHKDQPAEINSQRWRLGVSWVSGYLLTQLYVPLLLKTEGAAVAGQFGLSLAIANMLALVSQSWLTHAYPQMAASVAARDWRAYQATLQRALTWACLGYGIGVTLLFTMLWLAYETPYPNRMLSVSNLLFLLAAIFLNQTCGALALHLRSARLEPLTWVSLGSAVLTLAGAWFTLESHGVQGLLAVMLGVQMLFTLPCTLWVWRTSQKGLQ